MSTQSINLWNANGTLPRFASTCSLHNEASWNRFQVGNNPPFSLVTTLSHRANDLFHGFTQVEDGVGVWDVNTNIPDIRGFLHSDFGVPYELRDAHSDETDILSHRCSWAVDATSIKQDWSHGTSLQYGENFLIFNARHMKALFSYLIMQLVRLFFMLAVIYQILPSNLKMQNGLEHTTSSRVIRLLINWDY
jgi:hypothetical protein